MKIGLEMYEQEKTMWLKVENCMKQVRNLQTYDENLKGKASYGQIPYRGHHCLNFKSYMYINQLWAHITSIHKILEFISFDILHIIQNPHLHVGPCHFTFNFLQVIEQVVTFTSSGWLFRILEP